MKKSELKNVILECIKELNEGKVSDKDWTRMLNLVISDKDGSSIAKKITDKNKAINRFICGVKLSYENKKLGKNVGLTYDKNNNVKPDRTSVRKQLKVTSENKVLIQ